MGYFLTSRVTASFSKRFLFQWTFGWLVGRLSKAFITTCLNLMPGSLSQLLPRVRKRTSADRTTSGVGWL